MSAQWVSIVALLGWLILALSAYRAHRVDARKSVVLVLAWGAIFLGVAAVFSIVG